MGCCSGVGPTVYSQETVSGVWHHGLTSFRGSSWADVWMAPVPWVRCGLQRPSAKQLVGSAKVTPDLPASGLGADPPSHLCLTGPCSWNLIKNQVGLGSRCSWSVLGNYHSLCSKCIMFLNWQDDGIKTLYIVESRLGNSLKKRQAGLVKETPNAVISGGRLQRLAHGPGTVQSCMHICCFYRLSIH